MAESETLEVQVITTADLKAQTRRELSDLARDYGVPGWHGRRKDELIEEIKKVQRRLRRKAIAESGKNGVKSKNGKPSAKTKAKPKSNRAPAVKASRSATKATSNKSLKTPAKVAAKLMAVRAS